MSLPKEIKSNDWVKNWSGNWRTGFASLYRLYNTDLKPYIGINLPRTLLLCEPDYASNYLTKKDLDAYGKQIASLVIRDNLVVEKWAQDTLDTAKVLLSAVKKIKKSQVFTGEDLRDLQQKFCLHIPPHLSIKKVIDYLPENLQKKVLPRLRQVRVAIEHLFNEFDSCLRAYTRFIAKERGYPVKLTEFLTIEEIAAYLKNKKLPTQKELFRRSAGIALFFQNNRRTIISGNDFTKLTQILFDKSIAELKGISAYAGRARGVARIIFDPFKVKVFHKGDILVTGMTRPEFLPLMKKAGAFVTDAGGMLSHAAIVARELKKPCILGTELATQVFKDGDRVEVDAEKGIVRKIK